MEIQPISKEEHMRKDFGAKPYTYPQPVYIIGTYDENGIPDAMNAAWGGISNDDEISFCLSAFHKTVKNLLKTGAFTVSIATADQLISCDYLGIESGNKVINKVEKAGLTPIPSGKVNAPLFKELPMSLECTVKNYDAENERLTGKIINVSADESILTNGKIDPAKLRPLVFDPVNNSYLVAYEKAGDAFRAGLQLK